MIFNCSIARISAIRGKLTVRHLDEIKDLERFKGSPYSFYYEQRMYYVYFYDFVLTLRSIRCLWKAAFGRSFNRQRPRPTSYLQKEAFKIQVSSGGMLPGGLDCVSPFPRRPVEDKNFFNQDAAAYVASMQCCALEFNVTLAKRCSISNVSFSAQKSSEVLSGNVYRAILGHTRT